MKLLRQPRSEREFNPSLSDRGKERGNSSSQEVLVRSGLDETYDPNRLILKGFNFQTEETPRASYLDQHKRELDEPERVGARGRQAAAAAAVAMTRGKRWKMERMRA